MIRPAPADVIRKAREHHISVAEAKRVLAAVERIHDAKPKTRIEWTGNIQVHHPIKPALVKP